VIRRSDFIPDRIWVYRGQGSSLYPLCRTEDPDAWAGIADSDDAIVTQVDYGDPTDGGTGTFPTSSSSAPEVMEIMLGLLDVQKGMAVLEIGAGTGFNAALIAERATPGRVTTIEVDPTVANHARTALARTALPVTVVTGDGTLGYPPDAPYDRIMCTASVRHVPYTWIEQSKPGGNIVLPLVGGFARQAFLLLTVEDDGTASGQFHGGASFMRLRNQQDDTPLWQVVNLASAESYDEEPDDVHISMTEACPTEPFIDANAGFAVGLLLPGWVAKRRIRDGVTLLSHRPSGSWASVVPCEDEHRVYHQGPRRLWEDLETAFRWWVDAGRPDRARFGLTVTPAGQSFWLDSPDNQLAPIG